MIGDGGRVASRQRHCSSAGAVAMARARRRRRYDERSIHQLAPSMSILTPNPAGSGRSSCLGAGPITPFGQPRKDAERITLPFAVTAMTLRVLVNMTTTNRTETTTSVIMATRLAVATKPATAASSASETPSTSEGLCRCSGTVAVTAVPSTLLAEPVKPSRRRLTGSRGSVGQIDDIKPSSHEPADEVLPSPSGPSHGGKRWREAAAGLPASRRQVTPLPIEPQGSLLKAAKGCLRRSDEFAPPGPNADAPSANRPEHRFIQSLPPRAVDIMEVA